MQTKNRLILYISIFTLFIWGVVGCGSNNNNNNNANINLSTPCVLSDDLSAYQDIQSGDIIDSTGEEGEMDISIYQLPDGTKKACIRSGSAIIIKS